MWREIRSQSETLSQYDVITATVLCACCADFLYALRRAGAGACACIWLCVCVVFICVPMCHTKGNYADCLNEGGINHTLHCNHLQQFMFAINLLITTVLGILQIRLFHLFHFKGGLHIIQPCSNSDISYLNNHLLWLTYCVDTTCLWPRGHRQLWGWLGGGNQY